MRNPIQPFIGDDNLPGKAVKMRFIRFGGVGFRWWQMHSCAGTVWLDVTSLPSLRFPL